MLVAGYEIVQQITSITPTIDKDNKVDEMQSSLENITFAVNTLSDPCMNDNAKNDEAFAIVEVNMS